MIEVEGIDDVTGALDDVIKEIKGRQRKALNAGALMVQGDAVKSISRGSPSGKTYKRKGVTHKASAPGEAPATDTGELVKSINVKNTPSGVFVGSNIKYAGMLEFGTSNMDARPWLVPALEMNRNHIADLVKKAVDTSIKRAAK